MGENHVATLSSSGSLSVVEEGAAALFTGPELLDEADYDLDEPPCGAQGPAIFARYLHSEHLDEKFVRRRMPPDTAYDKFRCDTVAPDGADAGSPHCPLQHAVRRVYSQPRECNCRSVCSSGTMPSVQPRPPNPAPRPQGTWIRRASLALFGLGACGLALALVLAVLYSFVLPEWVENQVKARLAVASERAGVPITAGSVELVGLYSVIVHDLKVGPRPGEERPALLSVPALTVHADLVSVWRGHVDIASVEVQSPTIHLLRRADGTSDIDPLLDAIERRLQGTSTPGAMATSSRRYPDVEIHDGDITLVDDERGGRVRFDDVHVEVALPGGRPTTGTVITARAHIASGAVPGVTLPDDVTALVRRSDVGWTADVGFGGQRVELDPVPRARGLRAGFDGLAFQSPDQFSLTNLAAGLPGRPPFVQAPRLDARVAGLRPGGSPDLREVGLTAPTFVFTTNTHGGDTLSTIRAIVLHGAADDVVSTARRLASPPEPTTPAAGRSLVDRLRALPSRLRVQHGTVTWQIEGARRSTWTARDVELEAEHLLLRERIEASASAVGPGNGTVRTSITVRLDKGDIETKLDVNGVDLAQLSAHARPMAALHAARVDASLEASTAGRGKPVDVGGDVRFYGADLRHRHLAPEPITDLDVTVGGDVTWTPSRGDLVVRNGRFSLARAARVDFRMDVLGIGHPPPKAIVPLRRFKLRAHMAPTAAQGIYDAVPMALKRELHPMEFRGKVGFDFQADVDPTRIAEMETDSTVELPGFDIVRFNPRTDVRVLLPDEHHVHTAVQPETDFEFIMSPNDPNWVRLGSISPFVVKALRTNEDGSFYTHGGFSWFQVKQSIERNLRDRRYVRGASTVSMQLVKNVFLSHQKTAARKLQEAMLTFAMEQVVRVPKDRILEWYLNIVEWGPGVYGIHRASYHYFGKHPSRLTVGESVWLISILPGPRKYHGYFARGEISDGWWDRMQRLIKVMHGRGHINQEQYQVAVAHRPAFCRRGNCPDNSPGPRIVLPQ